jgi:hypothetical protein
MPLNIWQIISYSNMLVSLLITHRGMAKQSPSTRYWEHYWLSWLMKIQNRLGWTFTNILVFIQNNIHIQFWFFYWVVVMYLTYLFLCATSSCIFVHIILLYMPFVCCLSIVGVQYVVVFKLMNKFNLLHLICFSI